ncbi:unnamed protein product [Rodentolepis nana]|uniref:DH domain-containing protein n=1 Tax=Rodentolepis nana TaxID=102285 RepID=A0A0R3TCE3_RODNA|nr:unnamed protein product [Rodentolepis nana]
MIDPKSLIVDSPHYDPLADGVSGSDELNDFYYAGEDESSLTTESDELSLDLPIELNTSAPPLICLLPDYAEARVDILRKIEYLARAGLGKAVNQLDRLVQLYTEINEARQWISKGGNLNAPLTPERITEMDPAFCEETIKQLNAFLESREANLVLKGNPGQFRKQFSDLLNSEMKSRCSLNWTLVLSAHWYSRLQSQMMWTILNYIHPSVKSSQLIFARRSSKSMSRSPLHHPDNCVHSLSVDAQRYQVELSQMLRSVEEMENSLKMTISNLRQQISRNTFPIKVVPPAQHQHHNQPQTQQNSSTLSVARQKTTNGMEEAKEESSRLQTVDYSRGHILLCLILGSPGFEDDASPCGFLTHTALVIFNNIYELPVLFYIPQNPENPQTTLQTSSSPESKIIPEDRKLTNQKLYQRALHELLSTEVNYIKFLEAVTETFSPSLCDSNLPRLPNFIRDNRALLVVNLPEQLAFHKNHFYPQLLACDGDPFLIEKWADSSVSFTLFLSLSLISFKKFSECLVDHMLSVV